MGRMKEIFMEDYERAHLLESMYLDEEYEEYCRARKVSGYERSRTQITTNVKANWISKIKRRSAAKGRK